MEDLIKKINRLSYNSSNSWVQMTKNLENYLIKWGFGIIFNK